MDDGQYAEWRWTGNPLLQGMGEVAHRLSQFKEMARRYYFTVILSANACPDCGGRLEMIGVSRCRCIGCGRTMDPTVEFQPSACCGARLVRRTLHYACGKCGRVVPSRFLFDEMLFDPQYFREKMRESRERKAAKREAIRRMLAGSRSDALALGQVPAIENVPGLASDLDALIAAADLVSLSAFADLDDFKLAEYRRAILDGLECGSRLFNAFAALHENARLDRVRRFITLLFMCQEREVMLTQRGDDIRVSMYEDDNEG